MSHRRWLVFVATVLMTTMSAAADPTGRALHRRSVPRRVTSVSDGGSSVFIHLEDGESVSVSSDNLRIMRITDDGKPAPRVFAADLASAQAPAVASVVYRRDGTVRKVTIRVFDSEAATTAYLRRSASQR